jgi:hypothetical protein
MRHAQEHSSVTMWVPKGLCGNFYRDPYGTHSTGIARSSKASSVSVTPHCVLINCKNWYLFWLHGRFYKLSLPPGPQIFWRGNCLKRAELTSEIRLQGYFIATSLRPFYGGGVGWSLRPSKLIDEDVEGIFFSNFTHPLRLTCCCLVSSPARRATVPVGEHSSGCTLEGVVSKEDSHRATEITDITSI